MCSHNSYLEYTLLILIIHSLLYFHFILVQIHSQTVRKRTMLSLLIQYSISNDLHLLNLRKRCWLSRNWRAFAFTCRWSWSLVFSCSFFISSATAEILRSRWISLLGTYHVPHHFILERLYIFCIYLWAPPDLASV